MGIRGKRERLKARQTNLPAQEKSLPFPFDRENGMKMKNSADHCCATSLSNFRLKTGFSTASTFKFTGAVRQNPQKPWSAPCCH
jgi:hypothetical protein